MGATTLSSGIETLSALLHTTLKEVAESKRLMSEAERHAEVRKARIVHERARLFELEQNALETEGVPLAVLETLDTAKPWRRHWALAQDIPGPTPLELRLPQQVSLPYIEQAKQRDLLDFVYAAKHLLEYNFCIIDNFYPLQQCRAMRDELKALWDGERMLAGKLGGKQKQGLNESPNETTWRSDLIAWREGDEGDTPACTTYLREKADVFVQKVAGFLELACPQYSWVVKARSKMMCSVYPGDGAHYVKHYDNSKGQNKRILTCIIYLNEGWAPEDGGFIRLGSPDQALEKSCRFVSIAPLMCRALLFWSDERCPHEVSPAWADRYAVTIWYLDESEESVAAGAAKAAAGSQ